MTITLAQITSPVRVWSREEILSRPCPVPKKPGVYGWYFKEIPPLVPPDGCIGQNGLTLLYVGISPKAPPKNGKPASRQTLCSRIRYHMSGNAEGSTLRLTLGVLLEQRLGIELRRVGSGTRMTFGAGEQVLSEWLSENAFVCWAEVSDPHVLEEKLIGQLSLPLNLDGNTDHPFHALLTDIRKLAKDRARTLPVVGRSP